MEPRVPLQEDLSSKVPSHQLPTNNKILSQKQNTSKENNSSVQEFPQPLWEAVSLLCQFISLPLSVSAVQDSRCTVNRPDLSGCRADLGAHGAVGLSPAGQKCPDSTDHLLKARRGDTTVSITVHALSRWSVITQFHPLNEWGGGGVN